MAPTKQAENSNCQERRELVGMEINVAAVESSMEAAQKLSPELACDALAMLYYVQFPGDTMVSLASEFLHP